MTDQAFMFTPTAVVPIPEEGVEESDEQRERSRLWLIGHRHADTRATFVAAADSVREFEATEASQ